MQITFYERKTEYNKLGKVPLYIKVTGIKRIELAVCEKVYPGSLQKLMLQNRLGYNSEVVYKCLEETKEGVAANIKINEIYAALKKYNQKCILADVEPDRGEVMRIIQGITKPKRTIPAKSMVSSPSINSMWDNVSLFINAKSKEVNRNGKRISKGTIKAMGNSLRIIKEYDPTISYDVGEDWYNGFCNWCLEDKEYKPNTTGKFIKHFKQFLGWCYKKKLHDEREYTDFVVMDVKGENFYLSPSQLTELYELNPDTNRDAWRILIAMCSTAMYPNDLYSFRKDWVKDDRVSFYRTKRSSSGGKIYCELEFKDTGLFHFVEMCEEVNYRFTKVDNLTTKINDLVRSIGIDQEVTTRLGRRTWCNINYKHLNKTINECIRVTGHSSEKDFRRYLNEKL